MAAPSWFPPGMPMAPIGFIIDMGAIHIMGFIIAVDGPIQAIGFIIAEAGCIIAPQVFGFSTCLKGSHMAFMAGP